MERRIPRRGFIEMVPKYLAAGAAGIYVGKIGYAEWETFLAEAQKAELTHELRDLIEETPYFRAALGLTGYSEQVPTIVKLRNKTWQNEPVSPFQNKFPPYLYSYGELARFFAETVFTLRMSPYVVSGAEVDINNPNGYAFGMESDRFLRFAHNAGLNYWTDYDPRGNSALGFLAHELPGHGTDPKGLAKVAPLDTAVRLEHGKWRMQSKMLQVTGPLTESTAWRPNQWIAFDLGVAAGKKFVEQGAQNESPAVISILSELAKSQNTNLDSLRFNKRLCTILGRRMIREVERGKLILDSKLQQKHTEGLIRTLPETFAEMMMGCLINPDLVNNDPDILGGAQEVLSAIRGDRVPLEVIRHQLRRIPTRIEHMRRAEIGTYSQEPPPIMERVATADPLVQKVERIFVKAIEIGSRAIPNDFKLFGSDRELVADTFDMAASVYSRYPILTGLTEGKPFDPELSHAWVTQTVEDATAPHKMRSAIKAGYDPNPLVIYLNDQAREDMKKDLQTMDQFIKSDAFGT